MTDYETLSLSLLSLIAQGIAFQVTQDTAADAGSDMKHKHAQEVLSWQETLSSILAMVTDATQHADLEPPPAKKKKKRKGK